MGVTRRQDVRGRFIASSRGRRAFRRARGSGKTPLATFSSRVAEPSRARSREARGSRLTAPCRSRSGSNDRAGTHRRLLCLQELGQNLAHAPVRQLIARRQGFLERVADDLRAFARGWGVSAGWPRPRVRAGASERNDSLTGGGGRATRRSPSPPTPLPRVPCRPRPRSSPRAGRAATPPSPARAALATLPHARDASAVCRRFGRERRLPRRAIEASGSGEPAKAVITVNSTEAAPVERFFSFLSRKGLVFQIGTNDHTPAVIFLFSFRRAPICRCRDAKFAATTKTSVEGPIQYQNRALTDRRSR